ncbi:MAG: hypothetical protein WC141_05200 [Arcobacteraceae bacterium]
MEEEINVTMEISNSMTKLKVYASIFENSSHYVDFNEHEMQEFLITFGLNLKLESKNLMAVINQLDELNFRQNTNIKEEK